MFLTLLKKQIGVSPTSKSVIYRNGKGRLVNPLPYTLYLWHDYVTADISGTIIKYGIFCISNIP